MNEEVNKDYERYLERYCKMYGYTREEAEKHMYARENPDDYIKEYEMKDKFEGLSDIEIEIKERRNKNRK